jgi:hypothetical protein
MDGSEIKFKIRFIENLVTFEDLCWINDDSFRFVITRDDEN